MSHRARAALITIPLRKMGLGRKGLLKLVSYWQKLWVGPVQCATWVLWIKIEKLPVSIGQPGLPRN